MTQRFTLLVLLVIGMIVLFACQPEDAPIASGDIPTYIYGSELSNDNIQAPNIYSNTLPKKIALEKPIVYQKKSIKNSIPKVETLTIPSSQLFRIGVKDKQFPKARAITSLPVKAGDPRRIPASSSWQENEGRSIFYTTRDGMPAPSVSSLRQDHDGAIWGSSRYFGLWKYDGYTFTHFTMESGLIDNAIVDIWIDKDGDTWIGASTGLSIYDGSSFLHLHGENEVSRLKPTKFAESEDGYMWVGSIEGLYKIDKRGRTITQFTTDQGLMADDVNCLLFDKNGNLWIAHNSKGISKMSFSGEKGNDGYEIEHFPFTGDVNLNQVECMLENRKGNILIGTLSDLIIINKNLLLGTNELQIQQYKKGVFNIGSIYAMTEDRMGRIWVANENSIAKIIPEENSSVFAVEYLDVEKIPLADQQHYSILLDTEQNIWIGHGNSKLTKFSANSSMIGLLDDYDLAFSVRSLEIDQYGNTWFLSSPHGLYCYTKGTKNEAGKLLFYGIAPYAAQLVKDYKGAIWFAQDQLLYKIKPTLDGILNTVEVYGEEGYWPIKEIKYLALAPNNDLWMASNTIAYNDKIVESNGGGAYKLVGEKLYEYSIDQGLTFDQTHSIFIDSFGQVWFKSVDHGMTKYIPEDDKREEKWVHFTSDDVVGHALLQSLYFSNIISGNYQNKSIYVSSDLNHPSRMEIKSMPFVLMKNGQDRARFHKVYDDQYWTTSNFGLEMVKETSLDGEPGIHRQLLLTRDGYPLDMGGNFALFKEHNIWCPTHDNIYAIDLSSISQKATNRKISSFKASHKSENLSAERMADLSYDENYLRFNFNVTAVNQPENIFYRYQLVGFDRKLSEPITQTEVSYQKIPHGNYIFKVQAKNKNSDWGPFYEQTISISPPWWQSGIAYVTYCLLGAWVVYLIWRNKLQQIEQKNTIEKEQLAAAYLREMDEAKTHFFTNLSHEFRTPLTVILGMCDEIKEPSKAKKLIHKSGQNLMRLVNQMLDFSKLEAGKLKLNVKPGEFISFMRYLLESFESLAEHKKIKLIFETTEDELFMEYDEDKMQHILSNLLSNAIKFTPIGGSVKLNLEVDDGKLKISVSDTGIGIEKEKLPLIFDRYYQGREAITKGTPGTGIGLSFTKELIDLMDGSVYVDSKMGEGSSFNVRLPIHQVDAAVSTERHMKPNIYIGRSNKIKESTQKKADLPLLLLIEDNPEVVSYIRHVLDDHYDIRVAEDGEIGVRKAIELIPDIIISDVMMPFKDGYEVTEELKADERTSHIPIILLTAKADHASRMEGFKRKADAYLAKPFDKTELLLRLENMVALRQKIQVRYQNGYLQNGSSQNGHSENAVTDLAIKVEDAFVRKVNDLIQQNISDPNFVVDELAQALNMSRSQLYRKLKALTNQTVVSYLRSYRLGVAKRMLIEEDLNVSEVAYRVGFADPGYFSKVFAKEFGALPKEV